MPKGPQGQKRLRDTGHMVKPVEDRKLKPMRLNLLLVTAFLSATATAPTYADIVISCGGYSPSINDHVEWDMTIIGAQADWDEGQHFKARETKGFYVLTRPGTEVHINKAAKSYVMYGPRGQKAHAIEWSRKVSVEGCEIPKIGSQP
jgi:hypothetical protein